MIAGDTNILVRLLTGDDPGQLAIARQHLAEHGIHLLPTVLMETAWVLRSVYRWPRARIAHALTAFLVVEGVTTPRPGRIRWALARHAEGADLADMLHLAEATGCDGFATFDQRVAEGEGDAAPVEVVVLG
jgi:predicted nucleic-acid-binding protein